MITVQKTIYKNFTDIKSVKMKTLIDVNRCLWGKVKNYATVNSKSLNSAVTDLLTQALNDNGYFVLEKEEKEAIV
jgi:hypothetical protein